MDTDTANQTATSPGVCVEAGSRSKQPRARARHERGQALIEFAIVLPVLLTLVFGVITFGITLNNYMMLTSATSVGAQLLSISRDQTTDPCQTTAQAVYNAAPLLAQANLKFTIVLWQTPSTSITEVNNVANPSCSGGKSDLTQSQSAQVTVTYPCNLSFIGFSMANCNLTAKTTEVVQ